MNSNLTTYLKLIYHDCMFLAKNNHGLIYKNDLYNIFFNPSYFSILENELFYKMNDDFFHLKINDLLNNNAVQIENKNEDLDLKDSFEKLKNIENEENKKKNKTKKQKSNNQKILLEKLFKIITTQAHHFLTEITNSNLKEYNIKLTKNNIGDYIFDDVYQDCEKQTIFNFFHTNGIDPILFLQAAFKQTKKNKNYLFQDLTDIFNLVSKQINVEINHENNINKIDGLNNKKALLKSNENLHEKLIYNSEKLFDVKKIKNSLIIVEDVEIKGLWVKLAQYLEAEGKTLKEANAQIAKLQKEENIKMILDAFNDIRKRNSTPPSMIAAIKFYINQQNNLIDKKTDNFI